MDVFGHEHESHEFKVMTLVGLIETAGQFLRQSSIVSNGLR